MNKKLFQILLLKEEIVKYISNRLMFTGISLNYSIFIYYFYFINYVN